MDSKIVCLLNLLWLVPIASCSIIFDSSDLMGKTEQKKQDDPISVPDAATTYRKFDAGKGISPSDVESDQENKNPDTVIDATTVNSPGVDAAVVNSPGVDATEADSSAGSDDSADKKDQEKPSFCQGDDPCHGHGTCSQEDGTCTCVNEHMTEDCSACESGYTGYPECDTYFDWVTIPGGTFMMGSAEGTGYDDEHPRHKVTVQTFKMSKTEVTVAQYRLCVDAGVCSEPGTFDGCNRGQSGRDNHPVNCVDWHQANEFAEWLNGGRLPSEAEWEYAARSGGKDYRYPWGNEDATCEHAVIYFDESDNACGNESTKEVCSKPLSNTDQKLCDMAGNVWEWVEDNWHDSYNGAPSNGKAWIDDPPGGYRVLRGGSWGVDPNSCRSAARGRSTAGDRNFVNGFRVVLD